jgi:Nucleotidyltransferase
MFTAMTREQRRLVEAMRSTATEFSELARFRDEFVGGMQWLTVKQKDYLTRYRRDPLTGQQKSTSLGPRSTETEAAYAKFVAGRTDLERRTDELRPEMTEQARLAKALRLNRTPDDVAGVIRAIATSEIIDDVVLVGEAAVYGYENELAAQIPRAMLPDHGMDLLTDDAVDPRNVADEIAGVLRRGRVPAGEPTRSRGTGAYQIRTDEGLKVRLFTRAAIEDTISRYGSDTYGGEDAGRWALEQPTLRALIIDRHGRASPVPVLDPRAWCILRCMDVETRDMSLIARETAVELNAAVIRTVQERWPEPFEPRHVEEFAPLHQVLEGDDSFPPVPRI